MPAFQEEDIAGLLEEVGVDVTLGAVTTQGVVDEVDEQLLEGEGAPFVGKRKTVTVKTGSLPDLAVGALITVEGQEYKVQDPRKIGDGALTQILCTASNELDVLKPITGAVVTVIPPAVRTISCDSVILDLDGYEGNLLVALTSSKGLSGTAPSLAVTALHCATAGGTYEQVGAFDHVSTESSVQVVLLEVSALHRYLMVHGAITAAIGPQPSFAYAVRVAGLKNMP